MEDLSAALKHFPRGSAACRRTNRGGAGSRREPLQAGRRDAAVANDDEFRYRHVEDVDRLGDRAGGVDCVAHQDTSLK